jgi:hypothetical protein
VPAVTQIPSLLIGSSPAIGAKLACAQNSQLQQKSVELLLSRRELRMIPAVARRQKVALQRPRVLKKRPARLTH